MWCLKCMTTHIGKCPNDTDNDFLYPKFEPINFEPIKFDPILPKFELINFEPIKFEPIIPKFELPKFDVPMQPKFYCCSVPGCPGHPEGSGGRCFPLPGPGMRLGPPGGPTW